jgi:V/A-type H+-transporting ATPase subunit C
MDENNAYINARISAMKSYLLPVISYHKMLLMDLAEITRSISEGAYKEDITELSKSFKGIDLIEYALNLNLARTYQKLIDISEGPTNEFIVAYMQRWDNENIKSILRGAHSNISSQDIAETLVPVGKIKYSYLLSLAHKQYDQIVRELEGNKLIPPGIEKIADREREMDAQYYHMLLDLVEADGEEKVIQYVKKEIDYRNLKILLRLVGEGTPIGQIRDEMVFLGKKITEKTVERCKGRDLKETKALLSPLFPELGLTQEDEITILEQSIDKHLIMYGEKLSHLHMFSPLVALGYILRKYQEIMNLRLIVRGKQLGIAPDTMKKMLVV